MVKDEREMYTLDLKKAAVGLNYVRGSVVEIYRKLYIFTSVPGRWLILTRPECFNLLPHKWYTIINLCTLVQIVDFRFFTIHVDIQTLTFVTKKNVKP